MEASVIWGSVVAEKQHLQAAGKGSKKKEKKKRCCFLSAS